MKTPNIIYICGPISTEDQIKQNKVQATEMMAKLREVFPHVAFIENHIFTHIPSHESNRRRARALLDADLVIKLDGWHNCMKATKDCLNAQDFGLEILFHTRVELEMEIPESRMKWYDRWIKKIDETLAPVMTNPMKQ